MRADLIPKSPISILGQFGVVLPDDYVTFDTETTGLDPTYDLIVEWGHCIVENRKVVEQQSFLLNWYSVPEIVPPDYITKNLARIARVMDQKGRTWVITPERLQKEGVAPVEGLRMILTLLRSCDAGNIMTASHNGWHFDVPMLQSHFNQDLDEEFTFRPGSLLDTGVMEKAAQMLPDPRAARLRDESMQEYAERIIAVRAPIKWNLDTHCVQKYGLAAKHNFDAQKMHTAGMDAYVLYLLIEELRTAMPKAAATKGRP